MGILLKYLLMDIGLAIGFVLFFFGIVKLAQLIHVYPVKDSIKFKIRKPKNG